MGSKEKIKEQMYFYEDKLAPEFDETMNMYDLNKRIKVVFDELLTENIKGKELLDAGCGTGWFSKKAVERGASVTSMDLGQNLLNEVSKKCESKKVIGSIMDMPFEDETFDFAVCSEVIEHVPDPKIAMMELYRVLKPGGVLILTTPNKFWFFSLKIASFLKIRPYQGLENWQSWSEFRKNLVSIGFRIDALHGIHIFPFVVPFLNPIIDLFHRFKKPLGPIMVNLAARCVKD